MSEQPAPSDRDLIAAVERAQGVERGRALFAARHALQRYRDPGSDVAQGRDQRANKERRR